MGHDAIKLELIEWLTQLEDDAMIKYLKIVKDARAKNSDWWDELTEDQIKSIEKGLRDIDQGRVTPHESVNNSIL